MHTFTSKILTSAGVVLSLLAATAGHASILFDSPASGYTAGNDLISGMATPGHANYAYDSFTLAAGQTITGARFDSWTLRGDTVQNVDWAIFDNTLSVIASGTGAVSSTHFAVNFSGYDINFNTFSIAALTPGAGIYALFLENAVSASGRNVGWDETLNNSQSVFDSSQNGHFPNTFQILGTSGSVPEPASWALMVLGVTALGVMLRARRLNPILGGIG